MKSSKSSESSKSYREISSSDESEYNPTEQEISEDELLDFEELSMSQSAQIEQNLISQDEFIVCALS